MAPSEVMFNRNPASYKEVAAENGLPAGENPGWMLL